MDKSRRQFESFIKKETGFDLHRTNYPMTKREDQQYSSHQTNLAWLSWQASRESLEKERDEAIKHLILVFQQYANSDHLFMSAGENACEFLDDLGYGIDTGQTLELTDKGKQLIKEDWE